MTDYTICPACHTKNSVKEKYCRDCGQKLIEEEENIVISENGGIIRVDFYGNGFLYHMIRIIMGTLIETGLGLREAYEMEQVMNSLDRSKAGYLAPASGLFLEEVYYS